MQVLAMLACLHVACFQRGRLAKQWVSQGLLPPLTPTPSQADTKQVVQAASGFQYHPERPNATGFAQQKWGWSGHNPGAPGVGRHSMHSRWSIRPTHCISRTVRRESAGDWLELELDTRASGTARAASRPVVVAFGQLHSYEVRWRAAATPAQVIAQKRLGCMCCCSFTTVLLGPLLCSTWAPPWRHAPLGAHAMPRASMQPGGTDSRSRSFTSLR